MCAKIKIRVNTFHSWETKKECEIDIIDPSAAALLNSSLILNLNDRSVEAVAPEVLKRVLPEEVPGLVAGKAKAGFSGGFVMKTASAGRSFRTPSGRTIPLLVMASGSMKAGAGAAPS